MDELLGLRERKKLERRRCIEAAAIDLFEANGFDGTTIEDIAARADIAPRTFFYYFPTKEDVVLADYVGRLERVVSEFGQRPDTEAPWQALRSAFMLVAADYEAQRVELIRRFQIMADNPSVFARSLQLQAGWEAELTAVLTKRAGADTDNLTPRLMAAAALACTRSSLQHWLITGLDGSLPALMQQCFARLAVGLDPG